MLSANRVTIIGGLRGCEVERRLRAKTERTAGRVSGIWEMKSGVPLFENLSRFVMLWRYEHAYP